MAGCSVGLALCAYPMSLHWVQLIDMATQQPPGMAFDKLGLSQPCGLVPVRSAMSVLVTCSARLAERPWMDCTRSAGAGHSLCEAGQDPFRGLHEETRSMSLAL